LDGEDYKEEMHEDFTDPLAAEDPEGEIWEWEEEAKQEKIRKRRASRWEEGPWGRRGRGGSFRRKR
jgi:hypothetical protein